MLSKIRTLVLWFVLFSAVSVGYADAAHASLACHNFIKKRSNAKSISGLLATVAEIKTYAPKFLDPAHEAELSKKWAGTQEGPLLLTQTLHEKTAFITRPLLAADAGTVKSSTSASFTSMRLRHTWQGKDMSTNLGLSSDALLAKTMEGSTKLVPSTAKAVYLFMHGWGTKTTGHHVAAAFSNFLSAYGVVVLSIDAPHHAYGPRVEELSPREYATYLRDFRNEFIPSDVQTFIGGHSGGGFIADMMMRFSDDPDLKLKEAFAGAINLSGPMDAAPGKSIKEKNAAEDAINSNEEIMDLVPEEERDLSVLLLTQGKISATSGLSAETFMSSVNWTKPSHGGDNFLPTLVVMGERDGLYVGREDIFKEHLEDLSNTETHVMGLRPNFKGDDAWVAHMIFDHYKPGTKELETFGLVRDFIQNHIGEPLVKYKGESSLIPDHANSKIGIVLNMVQEYYNNLAFRIFAKEFELTTKTASPEAQALGARKGRITKLLKRLEREISRREKQNAQDPRLKTLNARLHFLKAELNKASAMVMSKYIPEGELKDFATENIAAREKIESEVSPVLKSRKSEVSKLRELREGLRKKQKDFEGLIDKILSDEATINPDVAQVLKSIEKTLNVMVDLQVKMNKANAALVSKNRNAGVFAVNPGPKEVALYKDLDQAYGAYNEALAKGRETVAMIIGKGATSEADLQLFNEVYGSVADFAEGKPDEQSLLGQVAAQGDKVKQIDVEIHEANSKRDELLQDYVNMVTPGLYVFEKTNLFDELNKPLDEVLESTSRIEPLWKNWSEIWKERPPDESTSLY